MLFRSVEYDEFVNAGVISKTSLFRVHDAVYVPFLIESGNNIRGLKNLNATIDKLKTSLEHNNIKYAKIKLSDSRLKSVMSDTLLIIE